MTTSKIKKSIRQFWQYFPVKLAIKQFFYIETEGLAMMAKDMGYTCWGLPQLEIVHVTK